MNGFRPAPVFVVNLRGRVDRKEHIQKQFLGRDEFLLTIVDAEKHRIGAVGLWKTIRKILENMVNEEDEFIILCEDDHQFTSDYSQSILFGCISEAIEKGADVLLGGPSWFCGALHVSQRLFWVDKFSGLQFTVLFRKFFKTILEAEFTPKDVPDYRIAALTEDKFFIFPFISTQVEFGYSDATGSNNVPGHVEELFRTSVECARSLTLLSDIYRQTGKVGPDDEPESLENICLPAYIIDVPGKTDSLLHIQNEFLEKKEFEVRMVEACEHTSPALSIFLTIQKIVRMAMDNDEEVIVICESDHQFTEHYTKQFFFKNVISAFGQNAEILSGGVGRFDQIVPVTDSLFWINGISPVQFTVLYKSVFQKILEEPYDDIIEVKDIFTQLTSHKMTFFPFISTKKAEPFSDTSLRLNRICEKKRTYLLS